MLRFLEMPLVCHLYAMEIHWFASEYARVTRAKVHGDADSTMGILTDIYTLP
jgi:hypothetical protein